MKEKPTPQKPWGGGGAEGGGDKTETERLNGWSVSVPKDEFEQLQISEHNIAQSDSKQKCR